MAEHTITKEDIGKVSAAELTGEKKMTREGIIARDKAVGRTCRGPLKEGMREQINALLSEGKDEDAKQLDAVARKRCGYDLNKIFLADDAPLDGEEHEYECPNCGLKGKYRAAGPADDQEAS